MAGAIGGIGAIGAMSGTGATAGLEQLAGAYRAQLLGGTGAVTGAEESAGASGIAGVGGAAAARGADFAAVLGQGLQQVESLDRTASVKAVQAATGDLKDVHDYTIAASEAQVATELTTTIRNKALEAFSEVMRMPL